MDGRPTRDGAPRRALRLGRSPFEPRIFLALVAAGIGLFTVVFAVGFPLSVEPPPRFDAEVAARTTAPQGTWTSTLAAALGRVGHLVVVAPIAVAFGFLTRWRSGRWDVALLLTAVLGGATVITGLLKIAVDRARPAGAGSITVTSAYPSGHAVRAAAVFGLIAWIVRHWHRHGVLHATAIPVAVALIVLNGGARVLLGVHWPTDVLVGLGLGIAWLATCWIALRPRIDLVSAPSG